MTAVTSASLVRKNQKTIAQRDVGLLRNMCRDRVDYSLVIKQGGGGFDQPVPRFGNGGIILLSRIS